MCPLKKDHFIREFCSNNEPVSCLKFIGQWFELSMWHSNYTVKFTFSSFPLGICRLCMAKNWLHVIIIYYITETFFKTSQLLQIDKKQSDELNNWLITELPSLVLNNIHCSP